MDDDSRLVQLARDGDDDAFEKLIKSYSRKVARIAGSFFNARESVEDLLQEVFLKVFQSLNRFKLDQPFEPWIIRITINACYDELRKIRKRRETTLTPPAEEEGQWLEELFQASKVELRDPEDEHLTRMVLGRVMSQLPPKDRATLTLRGEGYSLREIAAVLDCSMQAANLRLFRARRNMLKTLRELRVLSGKKGAHDAL